MSRGKLLLVLVVLAAVGESKPQEYGGHSYKKPNLPFFSHRKFLSPTITNSNPCHNETKKIESIQPASVIVIAQERCVVNKSPQPCPPTTKPVTPTKVAPPLRPTLPPRVTSTPSRPLPTKVPERTPSSWLTCITRRPPSNKVSQPCEQTRPTIPTPPPTTRAPPPPRPQPPCFTSTTRRPPPTRGPEPCEIQTRPTIQRQPPTTRAPPQARPKLPYIRSTTRRPPPTRAPEPCNTQTRPSMPPRPIAPAFKPNSPQVPNVRPTQVISPPSPPVHGVSNIEHVTDNCVNGEVFPTTGGNCDQYMMCYFGKTLVMNCPAGLAFNVDIRSCDWAENVPTCNPPAFEGFTCPTEVNNNHIVKYRYRESCRQYVACHVGKPRLLSCEAGLFFDDYTKSCVDAEYVTNCSDFLY